MCAHSLVLFASLFFLLYIIQLRFFLLLLSLYITLIEIIDRRLSLCIWLYKWMKYFWLSSESKWDSKVNQGDKNTKKKNQSQNLALTDVQKSVNHLPQTDVVDNKNDDDGEKTFTFNAECKYLLWALITWNISIHTNVSQFIDRIQTLLAHISHWVTKSNLYRLQTDRTQSKNKNNNDKNNNNNCNHHNDRNDYFLPVTAA